MDTDPSLFTHTPPVREEPKPIPRQAPPPVGRFNAHTGSRNLFQAAREYALMRPEYHILVENSTRLLWLKAEALEETTAVYVQLAHVSYDDLKRIKYEALSYQWSSEEEGMEAVSQLPTKAGHLTVKQPPATSQADGKTGAASKTKTSMLDDLFTHALSQVQQQREQQRAKSMFTHRQFFVSRNLYAALRRLRRQEEDVLLWIDAICIDQDDLTERVHQITHMSLIYSRAYKVLIWLGPGDSKTDDAIDFIKKRILPADDFEPLLDDNSATTVASWENMVHLMRSTWFGRRWIVQELALAKSAVVFCGNGELHWTDLRDAIGIISDHFDTIKEALKHSLAHDFNSHAVGDIAQLPARALIATINDIFREEPGSVHQRRPMLTLEHLVSKLAACHTSDPRDTITAFRNIAKETYFSSMTEGTVTRSASDDGSEPPEPDYKQDLLEWYIGFFAWIQRTQKNIDIICRRWAMPERLVDDLLRYPARRVLPSWIQTVDTVNRVLAVERSHGASFVGLPDGPAPYSANGNHKADYLHFDNSRPPSGQDLPKHVKTQTVPPRSNTQGPTSDSSRMPNNSSLPASNVNGSQEPVNSAAAAVPAPRSMYETNVVVSDASLADLPSERQSAVISDQVLPNGEHAEKPMAPEPTTEANLDPDTPATASPDTSRPVRSRGSSTGAQTMAGAQRPSPRKPSRWNSVLPNRPARPRTMAKTETSEQHDGHDTEPQAASDEPVYPTQPPADAVPSIGKSSAAEPSLPGEDQDRKRVIAQFTQQHIDASIQLDGIIVGTIGRAIGPTTDGVFQDAALEILLGDSLSYDNVATHIDQRVWRCLVAERGEDGRSNAPTLTERACRYILSKAAETGKRHINVPHLLERKQPGYVRTFLNRMLAVIWDRNFIEVICHTTAGRADPSSQEMLQRHGFGPAKLKTGDLLCVLYGCSVPVVLRQHEHETIGTYYRLIGEAYVYGMMDGESMPRNEDEKKRATTRFRLF